MICVSIQEQDPQRCRQLLARAPMAELRADLCRFSTGQLEQLVAEHPNLLITCRVANSSPEVAEEQLCAAIRSGARYVDVEIEAPDALREAVRRTAQAHDCRFILSYHDFEGTPERESLDEIVRRCIGLGAELVKIVTTARTADEAETVLGLYDAHWPVPLVAFAMGEAGRFTRFECLKRGAPYTYVAADDGRATAPGQYTQSQMEALLRQAGLAINR